MNANHSKAAKLREAGILCAGCGKPIEWRKNKRKPKYCTKSCAATTRVKERAVTPEHRLMSSRIVTASGCWELTGKARTKFGYRPITIAKRTTHAHRWAYEVFRGPIPDGLCVLHKCDNPGCFNPDHLFLGTLGDNNRDAAIKGRGYFSKSRGEKQHAARLTNAQASEVRRLKNDGMLQKDIAAKFRVSPMTISQIVRGLTYNENTNDAHP